MNLEGTAMKTSILPLLIYALFASGTVHAAGDSRPAMAGDPVLERAAEASNRKDWTGAQSILKEAVARDPNNPEYHNMYAYNLRKGANPDMSLVFQHYNEALRIDPKHKGANEYLGEAYLMVNNLPKAKEQLATLDKLCFFPCREFNDLKKSIAEYEAKPR
jgi:tetratricopeptide (TPR) repeat protein